MHKNCLPSESMWSGRPFLVVAGAMMGRATESAEHNASLNFFFASLEDTNQKFRINSIIWESLPRGLEWLFVYWFLWFSAGLWTPDLNENLESCCCAVWLAESGRSSVEMFCRVSSRGESCTLSSTQRSVNIYKKRVITIFSLCFNNIFFIYSMVYGTKTPRQIPPF